jgi:hypothetical protein
LAFKPCKCVLGLSGAAGFAKVSPSNDPLSDMELCLQRFVAFVMGCNRKSIASALFIALDLCCVLTALAIAPLVMGCRARIFCMRYTCNKMIIEG